MSSDRLALVVALGVATYFATQEPETTRGPVTTLAPVAVPAKPTPAPAPPLAVLPPPPPPASLSAVVSLTTTVEQLTRRLGDLASEVEQLNQWRAGQEAALMRKAARPVGRSTDEGRLETSAGSPPVRKPKKKARPAADLPMEMRTDEVSAKPEAGDVLGIGSVTDSLLKRIDRIEE